MIDESDLPAVSINIVQKQNQRLVGAAVHKRISNDLIDENVDLQETFLFRIELFEFIDNEQLSNVDTFLNQVGNVILYLSEDLQDSSKGDGKKIKNILNARSLDATFLKKSCFASKVDTMSLLKKLVGKASHESHAVNKVETERPIAFGCLECLQNALRLKDELQYYGRYDLKLESLNKYMRLDFAASDAVNLFPKKDHPSVYGSIFGVLNRCKTKMGTRLLERWLRLPLLDVTEINKRLDVVKAFKEDTMTRNNIRDGPLNGIPDLNLVLSKMQKRTGGLNEIYRLYLFVRSIPSLLSMLDEFNDVAIYRSRGRDEVDDMLEDLDHRKTSTTDAIAKQQEDVKDLPNIVTVLTEKFIKPLKSITNKFTTFERLVEHVVDINALPELRVNARHSEELTELNTERSELERRAEAILTEAREDWASFADVKLEQNPQHGFILRSTKAEDERALRAANSSVIVLSLQKNGVHFTTKVLQNMGLRLLALQDEYRLAQTQLVSKAVETASTYLPVVEAVSGIMAELDLLLSFSTAAALSPGEYVRPVILEQGSGVIDLKGARHPCVELMDDMTFLPNDYNLYRETSAFQLITGPNMGGKSTYIRGLGCIVVMAQVGMMVPCSEATISVIDCLLARVGAGDAVRKGISTFMAEMLESSVMLSTASRDSLLIIDELGRGTSTYDGYGIAYAISEYIITHLQCLCVFATHFHELTVLEQEHKSAVNKHVAAHVDKGNVVMLYQLDNGPCTESYGIHVAKSAGFPECVLRDARRKAKQLERTNYFSETNEEPVVSEEEKAKFQRICERMTEFANWDMDNMTPEECQIKLKALFPPFAEDDEC